MTAFDRRLQRTRAHPLVLRKTALLRNCEAITEHQWRLASGGYKGGAMGRLLPP